MTSAGYQRLEHHASVGTGSAWGELRRTPITLLPPEDRVPACDAAAPVHWDTDGEMRARIAAVAAGPAVTAAQRAGLAAALVCPGDSRCAAEMDPDLVFSLSPEAREAIYPILGRVSTNSQTGPFRFRDDAEVRARLAPLSSAARDDFTHLLYRDHGYPAFADIPTLCRRLPAVERRTLVRALNASPALDVRVRVPAGGDAAAVAAWYGRPDLAGALARAGEAGDGLDLRELLPPVPRARLGTFPTDADLERSSMNCFWTALNFFRADPDPAFGDPATVTRVLAEEYVEVPAAEARFGDVFTWSNAAGRAVHAAAWVGGDVFFTRNGFVAVRPFVLMTRADLDERYPDGAVRVLRRRAP